MPTMESSRPLPRQVPSEARRSCSVEAFTLGCAGSEKPSDTLVTAVSGLPVL